MNEESPRAKSKQLIWIQVGLVLGVLVLTALQRSFFASTSISMPMDVGTLGEMALCILQEGDRPYFMYGFPYSGALMGYLIAGSFHLFGITTFAFYLPTMLFVLGWVLMSFLLFNKLFGFKAGIVAAYTIAVGDWVVSYYSIAPDCSYSPLYFLGTTALWLTFRIARDRRHGARETLDILMLGFVIGLAHWTHKISVIYGLTCGLILLPLLFRRKFAFALLVKFVFAGLIFALSFIPMILGVPDDMVTPNSMFTFTREAVELHANYLVDNLLPLIWSWNLDWPIWVKKGIPILWALCLALYLLRLITGKNARDRLALLMPPLLIGLFLIMYLPHQMAATGAVRYIVGPWAMFLMMLFALPASSRFTWIRGPALVLLAVWSLYQFESLRRYAVKKAPERAERLADYQSLIDQSRKVGATHVVMVDHEILGGIANCFSYLAHRNPVFSCATLEQSQLAAQACDWSPKMAYCIQPDLTDTMEASLAQLQASFQVSTGHFMQVYYPITTRDRVWEGISPDAMTVTAMHIRKGQDGHLTDRTESTYVEGTMLQRGYVEVDLRRPQRISKITVAPPAPGTYPRRGPGIFETKIGVNLNMGQPGGGLSGAYRLEGSGDGTNYFEIAEAQAIESVAYTAGNKVFFMGGLERQEVHFAPTTVRYLRYHPRFDKYTGAIWAMSEFFVFRDLGPAEVDWDQQAKLLPRQLAEFEFVAADRWLSAQIRHETSAAVDTWPRYNIHDHLTNPNYVRHDRKVTGTPTQALVLPRELRADAAAVLLPDSYQLEASGNYDIYRFRPLDPKPPPVYRWNGFTVLR